MVFVAVRLKWADIDFERRIITLNKPEKRSNPRMWRPSNELMAMLKNLPKNNQKVFGDAPTTHSNRRFKERENDWHIRFRIQDLRR